MMKFINNGNLKKSRWNYAEKMCGKAQQKQRIRIWECFHGKI